MGSGLWYDRRFSATGRPAYPATSPIERCYRPQRFLVICLAMTSRYGQARDVTSYATKCPGASRSTSSPSFTRRATWKVGTLQGTRQSSMPALPTPALECDGCSASCRPGGCGSYVTVIRCGAGVADE